MGTPESKLAAAAEGESKAAAPAAAVAADGETKAAASAVPPPPPPRRHRAATARSEGERKAAAAPPPPAAAASEAAAPAAVVATTAEARAWKAFREALHEAVLRPREGDAPPLYTATTALTAEVAHGGFETGKLLSALADGERTLLELTTVDLAGIWRALQEGRADVTCVEHAFLLVLMFQWHKGLRDDMRLLAQAIDAHLVASTRWYPRVRGFASSSVDSDGKVLYSEWTVAQLVAHLTARLPKPKGLLHQDNRFGSASAAAARALLVVGKVQRNTYVVTASIDLHIAWCAGVGDAAAKALRGWLTPAAVASRRIRQSSMPILLAAMEGLLAGRRVVEHAGRVAHCITGTLAKRAARRDWGGVATTVLSPLQQHVHDSLSAMIAKLAPMQRDRGFTVAGGMDDFFGAATLTGASLKGGDVRVPLRKAQLVPLAQLVQNGSIKSAEALVGFARHVFEVSTAQLTVHDPVAHKIMVLLTRAHNGRRWSIDTYFKAGAAARLLGEGGCPHVAALRDASPASDISAAAKLSAVRKTIAEMALLYYRYFSHQELPNTLINCIAELSKVAGPAGHVAGRAWGNLCKKMAADIFSCTFSMTFVRAAGAAADCARLALYARYFKLEALYSWLLGALASEGSAAWSVSDVRTGFYNHVSNGVSHALPSTFNYYHSPYDNGLVLAQAERATTHNCLSLLCMAGDELADNDELWSCMARQATKGDARGSSIIQQQAAERNCVFAVSMLRGGTAAQRRFVATLPTCSVRTKLAHVLCELAAEAEA